MRCSFLVVISVAATSFAAIADEPTSNWHSMTIPDGWRKVPSGVLQPVNGYSWYRCRVMIPSSWKDSTIDLFVEAMDDSRATYFNGTRVGATGTFPPSYRSGLGEKGRYDIPASLLKPGEINDIAIRVFQNDPRPNFSVAAPVLLNRNTMAAIRLKGVWSFLPKDDFNRATSPLPNASHVFETVDAVTDVERYVARREGDTDPLTPQSAVDAFKVPEDLRIELVLSEPDIAQPLFMTWDGKGRLWVMEYRQYPEVAGVSMVSRDVYLRSVYDGIPKPPPHGDPGRDRITVHEDSNGDGQLDTHTTFVDGLNIATSLAIGRNGVFVTNPPYLLYYPDLDHNDVPDSAPEILLEGFGLEDSHSVINSLRFGPDGWLYGAQGSTVTASVKRPGSLDPAIQTMGQQIWRYHPELKKFEVFAEGGGNTFGCEIDSVGNIFSGHNGGDTRGFHYVQGGYYRKGFTKHGPLSNPYAFGFFSSIRHHKVARFTHNFVIYEDRQLPDVYRGKLFGIEPLQGQIVLSDISPYQSSFETNDVSRVIETTDQWFRPVDIKVGPDGHIYIADMYEQRIDHSSHYAGRIDRSNGRIYRLRPRTALESDEPFAAGRDLDRLTSVNLVELLKHGSRTTRQSALRILGDRRDRSIATHLANNVRRHTGQFALECLWALHQTEGLSDGLAIELLNHRDQFVRSWVVRLKCDGREVTNRFAEALTQTAGKENYVQVRKQLASSARRLPAVQGIPIVRQLLNYNEDSADIHQPLLVWWALEAHTTRDGRALIRTMILEHVDVWKQPLFLDHIAERLVRRYARSGTREELLAAADVFRCSPNRSVSRRLLKGFEDAFQGRSMTGIPEELVRAITRTGEASIALRLRQHDPVAIQTAVSALADLNVPFDVRITYIQAIGELGDPKFVPILLNAARAGRKDAVVSAALSALQTFDLVNIGEQVSLFYPDIPSESRVAAESLLSSRVEWAQCFLALVKNGRIASDDVSETTLRKMLLHDNVEIAETISQIWGNVAGATTEQMKQEIERVRQVLTSGTGNPKKGKPLFMKNCGRCHRLFQEGGAIGPDLTAFQRDNPGRTLSNVINPSLEIREGFENHVVVTTDGRVLNGFLADRDDKVVVLRGVDGQNSLLRIDDIDEMRVSPTSIMPEGSLKSLSEQQLRDLFAYFRSSQPVNY